jgi:hypothetical protein
MSLETEGKVGRRIRKQNFDNLQDLNKAKLEMLHTANPQQMHT